MKKNRLTALILTFVLLFGCLSVLPVFAEEVAAEDGQLTIVAQNVVYSEKIQIAFAVDYATATAAQDVKVAYTVDGETKLAAYWGVETINEVEYPVFVTEGFHANEFTKQVSTVAYTGEAAPAEATPKLYCVGQYFYSMLYKHNYINASAAEDVARKDLYQSAIAFGSNAQRVLDEKAVDSADLLNQYCFLWAAEGVTVNGDDAALVPAGTAVTLAGAASYNIGDVATGVTSYTAAEAVVAQVTANSGAVNPVTDYESGLPYSDYVKTYDSSDVLVETTQWATGGTTSTAGLDVDPKDATNHVLHVRTGASGADMTTKVALSNNNPVGNCYTFETKVYAVGFGGDNYKFANLKFVTANGKDALSLNLKSINNNLATPKPSLAIATEGTSSNIAENTILFDYNEKNIQASAWCTIRVEFYYAGGSDVSGDEAIEAARHGSYLKLYVDDVLAYDDVAHWVVTSDIDHVELVHTAANKAQNMEYDDISFTRTDKAYVAGN